MLILMLTVPFNAFLFLVFMLLFLASQLRKTRQAVQRLLSSAMLSIAIIVCAPWV